MSVFFMNPTTVCFKSWGLQVSWKWKAEPVFHRNYYLFLLQHNNLILSHMYVPKSVSSKQLVRMWSHRSSQPINENILCKKRIIAKEIFISKKIRQYWFKISFADPVRNWAPSSQISGKEIQNRGEILQLLRFQVWTNYKSCDFAALLQSWKFKLMIVE